MVPAKLSTSTGVMTRVGLHNGRFLVREVPTKRRTSCSAGSENLSASVDVHGHPCAEQPEFSERCIHG
jgi:hypothetical protein